MHHYLSANKAKVIVLAKPNKTLTTYAIAKGYRPIALLLYLGKVIEGLLAKKL